MEKKEIVNLNAVWKRRCELRAKGYEFLAKADKLHSEAFNFLGGYKIRPEEIIKRWLKGENLFMECYKLKAEAFGLFAESDKSWAEAILKKCGNIKIEMIKRVEKEFKWEEGRHLGKDCDCKLETGEFFKWL